MLVSIIIPIYNVAPYVEQCLQSVASQTYKGAIECILVDDCGTDESIDICERFIGHYNGSISFRILHHDHNRGLSASRNTGIDAAQGEYLYFLDSDDWIIPECIELMAGRINDYPSSQLVFAGATASDGGWKCLDYTNKMFPEFSDNRGWLQMSMLKRRHFGMTAWNKLISREFILANDLFFVEGITQEDEIWNFDISKHILSASFVCVNTYFYNIRPNSIMREASKDLRYRRLLTTWNMLISRIGGNNTEMQIRGICKYIYEETPTSLSYEERTEISRLYLNLAIKSRSVYFFRLLYRSAKVLW